jgi:hypothetical protein
VFKQVREEIKCLDDLLKGVKEVDKRENVWMEWLIEICRPADEFLTSFRKQKTAADKEVGKAQSSCFSLCRIRA